MDGEDAAEGSLVEALSGRGLVAAVGAGGKKTTLWRLAEAHDRAVVTAATRIPLFGERVRELVVTDDPVGAVESALGRDVDESPWPLGLVPGRADDVRYEGYGTEVVSGLADAVGEDLDAILLKADGARNRLFKAPDEHEPQVPDRADTVLPIASATVVGQPLDETHVHRPERVGDIADLDPGGEIEPVHVAREFVTKQDSLTLTLPVAVFGLFFLVQALFPTRVSSAVDATTSTILQSGGPVFLGVIFLAVCYCLFLLLGPWGDVKLGGPDTEPSYTYPTYFTLVFTA
ncbi:putative selenium-dependent hydroxylase accessory protein YqeC, partial [Halobacteriales archaeon QS_5_70_15]